MKALIILCLSVSDMQHILFDLVGNLFSVNKVQQHNMSNLELSVNDIKNMKDVSAVARGIAAPHSSLSELSASTSGNAATASAVKVGSALESSLGARLPLASPVMNGIPTVPTPTSVDNTIATTSFVSTKIQQMINGAPAVLDTLKEIQDALSSDANLKQTITTSLSSKLSQTEVDALTQRIAHLESFFV